MTDQEINRAVAESVGWKCQSHVREQDKASAEMCWIRPGNEDWQAEKIPDYCNDLNSIQEAEKIIFGSSNAWEYFTINLICVLKASGMVELDAMVCLLQATARQRAEAYLRTIGKWRDA